MKRCLIMAWMLVAAAAAYAQNELYIYQQGNAKPDTLQMSEVTGISHSRYDLQGNRQNDYVLMDITLTDSRVRHYLLAQLDSVVMQRGDERIQIVCFTGGMTADGNTVRKAPRRTSLDGDFMAPTSEVDFFWEKGDKIFVQAGDVGLAADSVVISENKRTADFYFKTGHIDSDEVPVYYAGQAPLAYNEVRVAKEQTQLTPNSTQHIGLAGDCGVAKATKRQDGQGYSFMLEHKAAYLCFMPYMANGLGRTVLKKITVRSDSAIAGVFTLTPEGIRPKEDASHVVTLTTGGSAGLLLPQRATQNTSAYMVIAPQNGSTRLTCEMTVCDTLLQSEGVVTKTLDLAAVEPNMVYVVRVNCNNYVVDLGLPVRFLNHNMGAFAPEEYGGYYAYGELEDKGNYTTGNYACQNTPQADIANIRLTGRDVAHVRLGGNFSMPTSAEMNMLKDSCTWTWTTLGGHHGYKITGKNGNALFMPAAGYRNGTASNEVSTRGVYRTAQLTASGQKRNWFLNFYSSSRDVAQSGDDIYLGESIRPVVSTGVTMTDGTLVQVMTDSVQWKPTQLTATLYGTAYGISKAKTPVETGFVAGAKSTVTVADGTTVRAAATQGDGKFSASFAMPKDTTYYYRAYARDQDGNVEYGNALQFGRAYVDLGLPSGTRWANINVGATRPDEDGDYLAWAETKPKNSYTYGNHQWYENSTWLLPENRLRNTQATRYDAAAKNWRGVWMTPGREELLELLNNCTFTLKTMNGVKGYEVVSRINQNKIFMTLSGWRRDGMNNYNDYGYMQSAELRDTRSDYAWMLRNTERRDDWYRSDGIPLRAVWKTNATAADGTPLYVRTLPARKSYDGSTEADTLHGVVRGMEQLTGHATTCGFRFWKHGDVENAVTYTVTPDADGHVRYVVNTGLEPGTTYHYAAFVDNGTELATGDTLDMTTVALVDLGLSVKWANVNLGAESEGAGGDFYRWGAKVPYRNVTQQYLTARDITPESGYDTATNLWGTDYRMPSKEEYLELIANTTRTWTTRNGYSGYLFTSTKAGYTDRSIFIPAAGYYYDSYHNALNANADYWTSTVNGSGQAYDLNFTGSGLQGSDGVPPHDKYHGFSVRAVQDNLAYLQTLNIGRNVRGEAEADTLKAYIHTPTGTALNVGFELSQQADMSGATQYAAGAKADGIFQYVMTGLQKGRTYYYRAYATDGSTTRYGKVLTVELLDYVDLGLPSGTLWANLNVGANAAECYGDYFAWGETQPKESYTQENCLTYGKEIANDIAGTEYDAATVNWGQMWCSPNYSQCNELMNDSYCKWEDVTVNGYNCIKITSKMEGYTDRFILLPMGGRMDGQGYTSVPGADCVYAPSTRYSSTDCYDFFVDYAARRWLGSNRKFYGYTMRPVMMKGIKEVADGVFANVKTEGIDWQWSSDGTSATVTLKGSVTLTGSVTSSWGFVVGNMQEVEAATPAAGNLMTVTGKNAGNVFEYTIPSYDGSKKFFRAFLKVGEQYFFGDIKTITAADLLAADFRSDGTAINGAFTPFTTATLNGTANVAYNAEYQRYEANFAANTFNGRPAYWYSFNYNDNITFADFQSRLADGHSLEVLLKVPEAPAANVTSESDAFASYEDGGSGIGISNRQLFTGYRVNSNGYSYAYGGEMQGWDRYYHVVAVWDKQTAKLRLYVNGDQTQESDTTGDFRLPNQNSRYYLIGGEPGGSSANAAWNGKVVYARIYDAPLTASQVQTLYQWK